MKILFKLVGIISLVCGVSNAYADQVITIGASPTPHAQILKQVEPMLKKQGITLKIITFDDYVQPNLALEQKQLDANYFQHVPYLDKFTKDRGITDLVSLVGVQIEPMGIYVNDSAKLKKFKQSKKLSDLPKDGLTIGVPNDPTNEGRALLLLQNNGFLTIKSAVQYPTKKDIAKNPYNMTIQELDPAMLPRSLKANQLDLAVINSNFAIEAGLNPLKDASFIEDKNSPYVNVVVVRKDELNLPQMQALKKALNSQQVKDYILKTYKGSVVPAF